MRRFHTDQLVELFQIADHLLSAPAHVVVIGGAALGLMNAHGHSTRDVDILNTSREVDHALEVAGARRGIPVQRVGVYFAPRTWEDRIEAVIVPDLVHLQVYVPEKHDLALMKIARGVDHDFVGVETIHATSGLEMETLVERYNETDILADGLEFRWSFEHILHRLFGDEALPYLDGKLPLRGGS